MKIINYKRLIKKLLIALPLIAICTSIIGSCECDLVSTRIFSCQCFNGHIDEMDPRVIFQNNGDTLFGFKGVASYSTGSVLLPSDNKTIATTVKEDYALNGIQGLWDSYAAKRYVFTYNSKDYVASIDSRTPANEQMKGDIMVIDADPVNGIAWIRVGGSWANFNIRLNEDNCSRLCDTLELYQLSDTNYSNINSRALKWGETLPNSRSYSLDSTHIRIFDAQTRNFATNIVEIPSSIFTQLTAANNTHYVDIQVRKGEIYYYVAKNGIAFALFITDVYDGSLPPNKEGISFKYAALRGRDKTSCPTP